MNVLAIGDLHLGHRSICKYHTQFSSMEEHDDFILERLSGINKRHVVWFFGDTAFTREKLMMLKKFPFRKKLVLGNHDLNREIGMNDLIEVYDQVDALVSYKNCWLSHCPIHSDEFRGRLVNIHGHTHLHSIEDDRYINICAEKINFCPIDLIDTIREIITK